MRSTTSSCPQWRPCGRHGCGAGIVEPREHHDRLSTAAEAAGARREVGDAHAVGDLRVEMEGRQVVLRDHQAWPRVLREDAGPVAERDDDPEAGADACRRLLVERQVAGDRDHATADEAATPRLERPVDAVDVEPGDLAREERRGAGIGCVRQRWRGRVGDGHDGRRGRGVPGILVRFRCRSREADPDDREEQHDGQGQPDGSQGAPARGSRVDGRGLDDHARPTLRAGRRDGCVRAGFAVRLSCRRAA